MTKEQDAEMILSRIFLQIEDAADPVVLVVRGHIIIDGFIEWLFNLHFHDAEKFLKRVKFFFADRCRLAYTVGLMSKSERDVLLAFNKLRNDVAHGLDFHISESDVIGLRKVFEQHGWGKIEYKAEGQSPAWVECLRHLILSLVGMLTLRLLDVRKSGKLPSLGAKLDEERWDKLRAAGVMFSTRTSSKARWKKMAEVIASKNFKDLEEIRQALIEEFGTLSRTFGNLQVAWNIDTDNVSINRVDSGES